MKRFFASYVTTPALVAAVLFSAGLTLSAQQPDLLPPGPAPADASPRLDAAEPEGVETLTQGPIHEAFANPAVADPTPGPVVNRRPPQDVPERPPEYAPEGDAVWIPGYWMWDDDRDDFIWVTGVWREIPPGMRWVPGYWTQLADGWQRVAGFWANNEVAEIEYRPVAPPETIESGPSSPAPSDDHFWIPGSWVYDNANYVWQSGYWAPYQPDWIWVPARWAWTPCGYVFVPGYWDYRLAYRGQIFAPIAFTSTVYTQPGWYYRPSLIIPTNNLFIHLWLRPHWCSYYFGNYYGPQFASRGFMPWANLTVINRQRYVYDPFFAYANVHYRRQGVDFIGRVHGWHNYYAQNADLRPARTWREQQQVFARTRDNSVRETQVVARNIADVARQNDAPIRFAKLDDQRLRQHTQHAEKLHELNRARSQLERESAQVLRVGGRDRGDRDAADVARNRGDDGKKGENGKKGDNGKKGPGSLLDKAEGNRPVARGDGGGDAGGPGPKLKLPKVELPSTVGAVARNQPGEQADTPRTRNAPPPRPQPDQRASTGRNTGDRGDKQNGRGPRATDAAKLPGDDRPVIDRPGADRPGADRPGADRPGIDRPDAGKVRDTAKGRTDREDKGITREGVGKAKSNDLPEVAPPGRANELPKVGGKTVDVPRPNPIAPANELPKVDSPGRNVEVPRTTDPGRGNRPPAVETPGRRNDLPGVNPANPPGRAGDAGGKGTKGAPERPNPMPKVNPAPKGKANDRGNDRPGPDRSTLDLPRSAPIVDTPRPNPGARADVPGNRGPSARVDNNPPPTRGSGAGRTETLRPNIPPPNLDRVPKATPQPQRSAPHVEPPRSAPRNDSPPPRVEVPRSTGRPETQPAPRIEPKTDSGNASQAAKGGKGKGRDRDNN